MDASLGLLGTRLRLASKGWCGVRLRVNKGIPLLGFRGGGSCMFLLNNPLPCFPAAFGNTATPLEAPVPPSGGAIQPFFPWWRENVSQLGGLKVPGRAPQALHVLKGEVNLPSHTSAGSSSGAAKQPELIPAHWKLPA